MDCLTCIDIQETFKLGIKLIEMYEGVFYRENLKISPFREVIDKLFDSKQKYKNEDNEVLQFLVEIIMNSLYGEQLRKDIEESFAGKSEYWILS